MRVPDISLTAGNAAQFTHISNNSESNSRHHHQPELQQSQNSSSQLNPFAPLEGYECNKNGNWAPTSTVNRSAQLTSTLGNTSNGDFVSNADEFVQRALSSAQAYRFDSGPLLTLSHGEAQQRQQFQLEQNAQKPNFVDNYTYKTGFQEVYVNHAAIAFENLENAQKQISDGTGNSKRCSLQNPNSTEFHEEQHNYMKKELLNTNEQELLATDEHTKYEINQQSKSAELYQDDNSDHAMLDLCAESPNNNNKSAQEKHNDYLDEYLTSPTTSSVSLCTPHRSYFPRGIINPNYPGFQHLAHTLSEHFIGCTSSDSFDSDLSECEMELSADSCDELPSEEQQVKLNMKMNLYNNNSKSNQSNTRAINSTLHQHSQPHEPFTYTDANSNSADIVEDDLTDLNDDDSKTQDLHNNLKSILTLNTPEHRDNIYADAFISTAAISAIHSDQKCRLVAHIYAQEPPPVNCPTPDILIKNCNLRVEALSKKENRPDLLRGVSPQPLRSSVAAVETDVEQRTSDANSEKQKPTITKRASDCGKDDGMSFGVTPVDIIGDFEQEVEREFGLLVSGYRRLNDNTDDDANEEVDASFTGNPVEKVSDAALSGAQDHIDSDKYVSALNQSPRQVAAICSDDAYKSQLETQNTVMDYMEDNNAVDWSYGRCGDSEEMHASKQLAKLDYATDVSNNSSTQMRPKYQKASYDERQLPPVAIEYKRCQQPTRSSRKSGQCSEKNEKCTKTSGNKIARNHLKSTNFPNRYLNAKPGGSRANGIAGATSRDSNASRKREEAELHQYQQLISDKELILSNSRYAKLSVWAQYLKDSVKNGDGKHSTDLASPSALELFDAYKISSDLNMEMLQKHLKMAKEIEKKRRSDREEIRRRLAMGAEEHSHETNERPIWKPKLQNKFPGVQSSLFNDASSDTESHSSDSETCPKLSKTKQIDNASVLSISLADKPNYTYSGAASGRASISSTHATTTNSKYPQEQQQQHAKQSIQETLSAISSEDMECDFFTKQAKLQIEARMALAQAKEMAHMQMEIERQNQRVSPITDIIRISLRKVGVQMCADKRRVSRQMLTDMNIAQLQIMVNSLHTHIEELNEALVHNLMERDDLHVSQDAMLVDIEELTRYIGANEHLAQQYNNTNRYN